jgi:hypothetical protein
LIFVDNFGLSSCFVGTHGWFFFDLFTSWW